MTSSTNPRDLVAIATDLQANNTKLEIVAMARAFGWKGDHARAPMLQLALFVATKLAAGEKNQGAGNTPTPPENSTGPAAEDRRENPEQSSPEQSAPEQSAPEQSAPEQSAPAPQQGEQDTPAPAPAPQQGEGEGEQDTPAPAPSPAPAPQQSEGEGEGEQDTPAPQQGEGEGEGEQDTPSPAPAPQQSEGEGEQDTPDDQEPEAPAPNEFERLLKAAKIHSPKVMRDPHRLLEKVWLLTAKAKLNVMLVGPAGSGKTMIAEQLAALINVPFGSVSCTMGMSESSLTGWLLPREGGNFKYTPAPFINCIQSNSVFLLDEVDAADANVMMVLNSALANGFISVPQRLDEPMVKRHPDSIIIAGANSFGGGSASYSARGDLDGATKDRFYPLSVDYDMSYIKSLFDIDRKTTRKSPRWKSTGAPDQFGFDAAREFIVSVMGKVESTKMQKIIGTRFAQKLAAALKVGIPFDEIKSDLFMGYTADEKNRLGVK